MPGEGASAAERPPVDPPGMDVPGGSPLRFTLRDGSPVVVRPILPEDKERLVAGFARLSEESRYRRFGTPIRRLSEEQLRSLTEVDYDSHMAWVALDPTGPGEPGLGVARYVRLPAEPSVAEAAVTVVDSHQGLGLGSILVGILAVSAVAHGITSFRAYVLAENQAVLELLRDLGARPHADEGPLLRVDVPIPSDPTQLPDTPTGRVLRAVASRMIPPFDLRYPGLGSPPGRPGPDAPGAV